MRKLGGAAASASSSAAAAAFVASVSIQEKVLLPNWPR